MKERIHALAERIRSWLPTFPQMIAFPIIQTAVYEITNRFSIYGKWFPVYCRLDEMIPLVKWFIIPYLFWFLYIFGTV
ncbi:MAG: hypothetical protein J5744_08070, partial [Oscillospiraceae bacterium]|nr:hypothetical protein [Oscillospiraceae bacterium]